MNYGLLYGIVACCVWPLGFPGSPCFRRKSEECCDAHASSGANGGLSSGQPFLKCLELTDETNGQEGWDRPRTWVPTGPK